MSDHDETYQLGVLLEVREREQAEAEEALALEQKELRRSLRAVDAAQQARDEATRRVARERRAMDERIASGTAGVAELAMFDGFMRGLREDVADAQGAIEGALERARQREAEVGRAQVALAQAVRALEAVRQHERKWKAERDVVARRRESSAMDDIAARIWREKNS
ncbi:MAG: hypothetical protein AAGI01_09525 [Myxococcota bacterium]